MKSPFQFNSHTNTIRVSNGVVFFTTISVKWQSKLLCCTKIFCACVKGEITTVKLLKLLRPFPHFLLEKKPTAKQWKKNTNEQILVTPSATQTKSITSKYWQYAPHLAIGFVLFWVAYAPLKEKYVNNKICNAQQMYKKIQNNKKKKFEKKKIDKFMKTEQRRLAGWLAGSHNTMRR